MLPPQPAPTAAPTPAVTATPEPADGRDRLALGITEPNPAFLTPTGPPQFDAGRADLEAIKPAFYRLVVDWPAYVSPDGSAIDLGRPQAGCMRAIGPCAPFDGIRAQLEALAAAQRAHRGTLAGIVVFTGTPADLAAPASGCERPDTQPRSRPPTVAALPAYRRIVRAVINEAARAGAYVPYWSPWNEPNHPYFLSPQHPGCGALATSASTAPYVRIARAMVATLDAAPGDQQLVLGETAGLFARRSTTTPVPQFLRGLPASLVCAAHAYGQHGYIADKDPVAPVARALARFGCERTPQIWITETGIKDSSRKGCREVARRLERWYRDPRVTAAFQYTLREDDRFPTGLVSTDLARVFPVLDVWKAWGARPDPASPPPDVSC